jgi:serine phosphatase RsbU (regulator of sigma subunit)
VSAIDAAFQQILIFKEAFEAAKHRFLGIMPNDEEMQVAFDKGHFIYFRPKDGMGGDFYQLHHNGERILVVADCSGHSVEGALMAMLASGEVDTIVRTRNITEPRDIIRYLHKSAVQKWSRTRLGQSLGISMEVSVINISADGKHLKFCGALRPMYLVREGQLQEFERSVVSVGDKAYSMNLEGMVQHNVELESGDVVYMFTDGYETQQGGDLGKPYGKKRFRRLIETASALPLGQQQAYLEAELDRWRGSTPQYDDICVLAVTT